MVRVLSNLQRAEQAAVGKLDGLEKRPLAEAYNTNASEAHKRSTFDSPAQPALHGALSMQTTADARLSQHGVFSTQDAVIQLQGMDVPQGDLQSAVQAMSVVQASLSWARHPLRCMCLMCPCACHI